MVPQSYPWYGGLLAAILVFAAVGCIPGVAVLRKFRIMNWDYAKQEQAETGGYTQSTAAFIRSVSSVDSGNTYDDVVITTKKFKDNVDNDDQVW